MSSKNKTEKDHEASSAVKTVVMEQPTLNLCSDYDIGCRIDEKNNPKVCEDCFYGTGWEGNPYWNGADGYCPILRKSP